MNYEVAIDEYECVRSQCTTMLMYLHTQEPMHDMMIDTMHMVNDMIDHCEWMIEWARNQQ